MNKFEIRVTIMAGAVLSIFLFALLYNTFSRKIDVPACVPYSGAFQKAHVKKLDNSSYEIFAVAHMWAFDPVEITLPVNSSVDLYLTSTDVVHGFNIERKGVNLMAVPGGITKSNITFTKAGVYRIVCHEYCGVGHQNMMGKIIVTDNINNNEHS